MNNIYTSSLTIPISQQQIYTRYLAWNMLNNLILLSTMALAEGPKFSILAEQEPAPFEGVLCDPEATAAIMSEKEMWQRACDLEVEFQIDQQGTKFNLDIQNAQIRYDSLKEETDLLIEKKDLEI